MTLTKLEEVKLIAIDVVRGNMPVSCLSGCIHVLADEIEEIKKEIEKNKKTK